jgi:haloacetate dehalogenase
MTLTRRDILRHTTALAAASIAARSVTTSAEQAPATPPRPVAVPQAPAAPAAAANADTTRFFPGFKSFKVQTTGATINGVVGGSGPPILLLHGAPQSHVSWRLVAPKLMATHTVVVPDLRGYGDSSKPADTPDHGNYSKRAMALDQVEVMKHFGFDRFPVIGQDRGGRVTHRLLLDHPEKVSHAAVLDIVPTQYLYTHVTMQFVQAYFHWFNYLRPAPAPENELKATNDQQLARATTEIQREYLRTMTDPATIHAMCEDYRASASIDLKYDEADLKKKIACPLLVLWAEKGSMGQLYDVLGIWKERGKKVTGKSLPGGHNLQEDVPDLVFAEIQSLLRT